MYKLKMISILLALLSFETAGCIYVKSNKDILPEEESIPEVIQCPQEEIEEEDVVEEEFNLEYIGEFLLTGYCDCEICQEEWVGTTALGVAPQAEWTIAVDPNVIPLGSYIWINGVRYHAEDVGGMINEYHIDVFCNSHQECYSEFCNGYADVYIEK